MGATGRAPIPSGSAAGVHAVRRRRRSGRVRRGGRTATRGQRTRRRPRSRRSAVVVAITSGERPCRYPASISVRRSAGSGQNGTAARDPFLLCATLADAERAERDRGRSDQRQRDDQQREASPGCHVVQATASVVVRCRSGTLDRSVTPKRLLLLRARLRPARDLGRHRCRGCPRARRRATTTWSTLACSVPHEYLLRTWRGWSADRGAQLSLHREGAQLRRLRAAARRPVGLRPGRADVLVRARVRPGGASVERPVTVAGIAPTIAKLLHFDGFTGDRRPADDEGRARPRDRDRRSSS